MHTIYVSKFDARKLIEHFGGVHQTTAAMVEIGSPVGFKTVQKWRERDNVPGDAVASLMLYANTKGIEFNPYDFLLARIPTGGRKKNGSL